MDVGTQSERFEQKTALIRQRLQRTNQHWEDTFFMTLARNYGFGLNGDAFETGLIWFLSGRWISIAITYFRLRLSSLDKRTLTEEEGDEYYLSLRKEYLYLKHKFSLNEMDASLWRFLRLRPGNFPHVRIAQLAYLYHSTCALLSKVVEAASMEQVKKLLLTQTSAYWEVHFIFSKPSPRRQKHLSEDSLNLILINTVVPFLYAYGLHKGDDKLCQRAGSYLELLKAENNHVIRLWQAAGIEVESAADSQAILQLQKEYCDKKDCLRCRFGYEYLKHK